MSETTIYHNTRCAKSRQTLALLREHNVEPTVIEYLKQVPTRAELELILAKLNLNVKDIIRTGEQVYKTKFKKMNFTDDEWIIILLENPKLIERPIVTKGNKAVIGRPPENVLDLI